MNESRIFCVAGIDTDIGKTVATGLIARGLLEKGVRVITQKGVQTGCAEVSEDIVTHRHLMQHPLMSEDHAGLTCQYLYRTPCSPHLAARREGDVIVPERMTQAAVVLAEKYDVVLFEGAGGLFVPLTEQYTFIDYLADTGWPVILVTSSRLGSINHTLASLEGMFNRNIALAGVVYNHDAKTEQHIAEDSFEILSMYLKKYDFSCPMLPLYASDAYAGIGSCAHLASLCGR
jgi:dethiobiotin synthetase